MSLYDQWDVDNAGISLAGLTPAPVDGTVVEGLPSGDYRVFGGDYRRMTSAVSSAGQVDDAAPAGYPQAPVAGGGDATSTGGGITGNSVASTVRNSASRWLCCRSRACLMPRPPRRPSARVLISRIG